VRAILATISGSKAEVVFFDGEGLNRLALENFLAGFHVGEGEELIAEGLP
jgi:hypothetical protein